VHRRGVHSPDAPVNGVSVGPGWVLMTAGFAARVLAPSGCVAPAGSKCILGVARIRTMIRPCVASGSHLTQYVIGCDSHQSLIHMRALGPLSSRGPGPGPRPPPGLAVMSALLTNECMDAGRRVPMACTSKLGYLMVWLGM
jgi:hypothetical protein